MPQFDYGPFAPNRNVPAQQAGEALEEIREAHDGVLVPQTVVDVSKPETAPLHPVFEWRDKVAANLHRVDQAANLIRSVRVIRDEDGVEQPEPSIMYVAIGTPVSGSQYVTAETALTDEAMRAKVLADVQTLLRGIAERHRDLVELSEVFAAIERAGQRPPPVPRRRRKRREAS